EIRSRFGFRLREGLHHGAEAAKGAAGEKVVVRGANELNGNIVRLMGIPGEVDLRGLGAAGQQTRRMHIVARHGLADLLEDRGRRLVMESLAQADLLELVRKNAQKVEVRARAHHFSSLMEQLDFAGRVRDAAVLFVGGSRRENDVGLLSGLCEE